MNILFITRLYYPHIGGVEKHVQEVKESFMKRGLKVKVISEENIKYPHFKFLGLVNIWFWLFKNRNLIDRSDVVHVHDVFIWYLPFRFIYPHKKVFTTFHGWEQRWPIPWINIVQKKIASKLSSGAICVGEYVEKYYGIKADRIVYGGVNNVLNNKFKKLREKFNTIFIGRLSEDTGLLQFLDWLKDNPKYEVEFCGDGPLRKECEKYGTVHGFTDPIPFYKKSEYCVPGGYLAALEALSYGCKLKLFWNNKIKEDYWKMSPFYQLKGDELKNWAKKQTWDKLADEYLDLYNHTK
ncbi:MAG TPA: glycosyltransferase family 4 protein [Candidatus Saccharimonadales bacterium]|jgi:glycosyltransferase involved in cell wall biosynthesis|nr:glycosyltransferase family 4 protein [Candidatus Saccharimonadales bacterium]